MYDRASNMGYVEASYCLALCYKNGDGVAQDSKAAFELFERAAHTGKSIHVDALNCLGECYLNGEGVDEDKKNAVNIFRSASELMHGKGTYNLARCYFIGLGVEKDRAKAFKLYELASLYGDSDGVFNDRCIICTKRYKASNIVFGKESHGLILEFAE